MACFFPGYLSDAELMFSADHILMLWRFPHDMRRTLLVSAALETQPSFPWQFWLISAERRELHKTNLLERGT